MIKDDDVLVIGIHSYKQGVRSTEGGEITIFDKAYIDFCHLFELTERGIYWVSRAKDNLQYDVVERLQTTDNPRILRDEIIELTVFKSHSPNERSSIERIFSHLENHGLKNVRVRGWAKVFAHLMPALPQARVWRVGRCRQSVVSDIAVDMEIWTLVN